MVQVKHVVIPSWYQRSGYVRAMADLIIEELGKFRDQQAVEVFFSAHGVPQSYVDDGEQRRRVARRRGWPLENQPNTAWNERAWPALVLLQRCTDG